MHSNKPEETPDEDRESSSHENSDEVDQFSSDLKKMDESLLNFFRGIEHNTLSTSMHAI